MKLVYFVNNFGSFPFVNLLMFSLCFKQITKNINKDKTDSEYPQKIKIIKGEQESDIKDERDDFL